MQSVSAAKGHFVWFELMTLDVPAAIDFYKKVVGWETTAYGDGGYTMWKVPGQAEIGGVMALDDGAKAMGARPSWIGNLCVESCDASVQVVLANGGTVLKPAFDIPNIGRVAIVADPSRAVLALYQPAGAALGHAGTPTVGEVSWSELVTADPIAAWAFYSALAGWVKTSAMEMGPMGTYQMFGPSAESTIGGMMPKPEMVPVSMWSYYFYVADLTAAIAAATANGGVVLNGPQEIPGGDHVATLQDPQGAVFSLHGK